MRLIPKLSVKSVFGNKKDILNFIGEGSKPLIRVFGLADKYEVGEGDNGPWVKFKGSFKGVNMETGEEFRAGNCFLPSVAEEMLVSAVDSSDGSVQFGFDIVATYDESSTTSYSYSASPLVEVSDSDPLAAFEASLPALALPNHEPEEGVKGKPKPSKTK